MKERPRLRSPDFFLQDGEAEVFARLAQEKEGREFILLLYLFRLIFKSEGNAPWLTEKLSEKTQELTKKGLEKETEIVKKIIVKKTEEEDLKEITEEFMYVFLR